MKRLKFDIHTLNFKESPEMPSFDLIIKRLRTEHLEIPLDREKLFLLHGTVGHKLCTTIQRYEEMRKIYPKVFTPPNYEFPVRKVQYFKFKIALESFFESLYGSLQIFGKELILVYGISLGKKKDYFPVVVNQFKKEFPDEEITQILTNSLESEWFDYLNKSRNRVEHGIIQVNHFENRDKIILVDDQKKETPTMLKKLEVLEYSKLLLNDVSKNIDSCSKEIEKLIFKL